MTTRRIFCHLALLPLLAGCISLDMTQKIDALGNAKVELTYDFSTLQELAKSQGVSSSSSSEDQCQEFRRKLLESVREKKEPLPRNIRCEQLGPATFTVSYVTRLRTPAFTRKIIQGKKTYVYTMRDVAGTAPGPSLADDNRETELSNEAMKDVANAMFKGTVTITMPARVIKTNVGTINGSTVTFTFEEVTALDGPIEIRSEDDGSGRVLGWSTSSSSMKSSLSGRFASKPSRRRISSSSSVRSTSSSSSKTSSFGVSSSSPKNPVTFATADDDPMLGNASAPVLLIEFTDFQCPFCQRHYAGAHQDIKKNYIDTGKVKLVVRDFALSFHHNAHKAAEAAECADRQGAFWKMHDKLFESQKTWESLTTEKAVAEFKKMAADLNLSTVAFNACLDNGEAIAEVDKDYADGVAVDIQGTPGFWIVNSSGKTWQISGALPYDSFAEKLDEALR